MLGVIFFSKSKATKRCGIFKILGLVYCKINPFLSKNNYINVKNFSEAKNIQKKTNFFKNYRLNMISKKTNQNEKTTFEKKIFDRRDMINLTFLGMILNNNYILENFSFLERKKDDIFFSSETYLEKKNEKISYKKEKNRQNKNFLKFLSYKEIEIETIEKFLRIFSSSSFLGFLIFIGISSSDRFSTKIELPETYSPNQITAYFKLRPEKLLKRFSQIFFEISKLSIGLISDYIFFPKNEYYEFSSNKQTNFEKFISFLCLNYFYNQKSRNILNYINDVNSSKNLRMKNLHHVYFFRKNQKKKKYWQIRWDNRAKELRETITKLSPAFIKLAQALVTRPDIVSERISNELQRLQDDMPFFSNEKAFNFIKKELGANPEQIFSEMSDEPVAAASLGQVYKANLDGMQVAIKVQRPGLSEMIALDIFIIRFLSFMIQKSFKIRTDLVAIVDEYAQRLFEELDYRKESSNMIKFRSLYGFMDMIYIPKVFVEYSSKHVLVMEWVEGERLIKHSVKSMQEDVSLIEIGVRCSLVQLLETGFLHCDPHGGNLVKTKTGCLAYLDYGLVSEIPETVRFSFISAILNLINREYESLAKDFNGMALIRNDDLDKEISKISLAFFEIFDKSLSNFDKFTFQDITEKILRLTAKFPFILPPYFLNNLRAIATLEGLALKADPNFKIADVVYPYIINKLLTNPAPQFQGALEDFLIDTQTKQPNWNRLEALLQDPEWTETFSEQSENLSDTVLNFIISPTGNFLKSWILQSILESLSKKFSSIISFEKNKNWINFLLEKKKAKKNNFVKNNFENILFKNEKNIIFPNFNGSKIYSWNTLFLLLRSCFLATSIIISEFILKSFFFFFTFLWKKFRSISNVSISRKPVI